MEKRRMVKKMEDCSNAKQWWMHRGNAPDPLLPSTSLWHKPNVPWSSNNGKQNITKARQNRWFSGPLLAYFLLKTTLPGLSPRVRLFNNMATEMDDDDVDRAPLTHCDLTALSTDLKLHFLNLIEHNLEPLKWQFTPLSNISRKHSPQPVQPMISVSPMTNALRSWLLRIIGIIET